MEITTLRLVLRRGFVLSEYISGDYNVCEREERIPMPELSPETNGEEREREVEEKNPPSLVVGVAYIECATPSPIMLHGRASMP